MKIEELAKNEKPYYGSGVHEEHYECFQDFYSEMKDYDIDLNLVYRFDIKKNEKETGYHLFIFTILQRKGRITEHYIKNFYESDLNLLSDYLNPHRELCNKLINF